MSRPVKSYTYTYQTIADCLNIDIKLVWQDEKRGLFALHDLISISLYISRSLLNKTIENHKKSKEVSF